MSVRGVSLRLIVMVGVVILDLGVDPDGENWPVTWVKVAVLTGRLSASGFTGEEGWVKLCRGKG